YLAKARALDSQAQQYTNLSADQQSSLQQGETQIANNQGKSAYETLKALVDELQSGRVTYTVRAGDSLWDIAGRPTVYGNPLEWPLIYLENSGSINDPDV